MILAQAKARHAQLADEIRRHDHAYYVLAKPDVTDREYDLLYRELQDLEQHFSELITPSSPTQRVGAPLPKGGSFATAEHLLPMGSIESLMTADEVREFGQRARKVLGLDADTELALFFEPKLYGNSANPLYQDGLLVRGVLIRHLVLPGQLDNTRRVIDWVAETFRPGEVLFSLMSQYTPQPGAVGPLARHVTRAEYRAAAAYMENCGIRDGFTQERTSAREEYTPAFDLTGV